jgi:hypothetical protein
LFLFGFINSHFYDGKKLSYHKQKIRFFNNPIKMYTKFKLDMQNDKKNDNVSMEKGNEKVITTEKVIEMVNFKL